MNKQNNLGQFRRDLREAVEKVQKKYQTNGNLYIVTYAIRKVNIK